MAAQDPPSTKAAAMADARDAAMILTMTHTLTLLILAKDAAPPFPAGESRAAFSGGG
jgi:hypothetical protein